MENDRELISIILPVYNVENYLDECVQSILGQSYGDFELIMVDDGSQDASGEMCDEYAKKDSRIVVIHKSNGGLSDARNIGIEKAKGVYITFIDSDDTVSCFYLEFLYNAISKNGAELSQCALTRYKDKLISDASSNRNVISEAKCFMKEEAFRDFLHRKNLYVSSCAKLYRHELFEAIRFPEGYLNEDNFTTYKLIYKAKKCVCINEPLYWHRVNAESIMQSGFSEKKMLVRTVPDEIMRFLRADIEKYKEDINYYRFRQNLSLYNRMLAQTQNRDFLKEKNEIRKEINNFRVIDKSDGKFRLVLVVFRYAHPIYKRIIQWMFRKGKIS